VAAGPNKVAADALAADLGPAGPEERTRLSAEWTLARAVSSLLAGRFSETLADVAHLEETDTSTLTLRQTDALLTLRCLALRDLGRLDEARQFARTSIATRGSQGLGVLPIVGAGLELDAGRPRAARVLLGTLADSSHLRRHPYLAPVLAGAAGVVEAVLGNHDDADELFAVAERDIDRAPTRAAWMVRTAMARVLGDREPERARHLAAQVAEDARRLGAAVPEASALLELWSLDRGRSDTRTVAARIGELTAGFEGERWHRIRDSVIGDPAHRRVRDAHVVRTPSP